MRAKSNTRVAVCQPLIALVVACGVIGCTTTSLVHTEQIKRLDGYEAGQAGAGEPEPQLETLNGETVSFGQGSKLHLGVMGTWVGGRFDSIRVRDGEFEGRTANGEQIRAPLAQISAAKVERTDHLKSVLLVCGVVLGSLLAGTALIVSQIEPTGGRALRVGGKVVTAPPTSAVGWRTREIHPDLPDLPDVSALSAEARSALAAAWTKNGRFEHASVPAFSRLSLSLVALGAPARLVEHAHRAALEEIEHARLSFALAEGYGGTPVAPGPLPELFKAPAVTVTSLADLAFESLVDGCVREGAAAAYVHAAHARATDPAARAALSAIARDESSHAELAWDVVCWATRRGGDALYGRLAVLAGQAQPGEPPVDAPAPLASALQAHGWPGPEVWRDLFRRTQAEVLARLERLVAQRARRAAMRADAASQPASTGRPGSSRSMITGA